MTQLYPCVEMSHVNVFALVFAVSPERVRERFRDRVYDGVCDGVCDVYMTHERVMTRIADICDGVCDRVRDIYMKHERVITRIASLTFVMEFVIEFVKFCDA